MIEEKNIELKNFEENKENNPSLNSESDKINYSKQINNTNNISTKTSILFSSTQDFSSGDTLYGNNYIKYYFNNKLLSSNELFHLKPKKMGNLYVSFFINDQPIFAIGKNKLSLVIIYELTLHLSFIILMITIMKSLFLYMKIMHLSFYFICFISHMFIFLINPGIPDIQYYSKTFLKSEKYVKMTHEERKNYYLCETCNIIVNSRDGVEHCDECGICLKKHDHHCYWTGKCIAKNNLWAFTFFTLGTLLYIVWYFILIIFWIILKIAHFNAIYKEK